MQSTEIQEARAIREIKAIPVRLAHRDLRETKETQEQPERQVMVSVR